MGILKLVPLEERIVLDAAIASVVLHVTNGHDSGTGSLRAAIATANAASGVDTIEFTLSPSFNGTINLTSGPLNITHAVNILGNGQVTVNDGAANFDVFDVNASNTTLSGLTVVGQTQGLSAGAGVELNGNNNILTNDTILSNHYGVLDNGGNNTFTSDFVGTNSAGSATGGNDFGLYLNGSGRDTISNDVISNNISNAVTFSYGNLDINGGGIYIAASTAGHDLITNNDIGTNPAATATLDNGAGILSVAGNLTITGNTIAGYNLTASNSDQTAEGVALLPGANNNLIANNDFDLSFNKHGVATSLPSTEFADTSSLIVGSSNNQVLNNVFAGTSSNSINLFAGSTNDLVQGNYIGVTPEGQNLGGSYFLNEIAIYAGVVANVSILDNVVANQFVQPQNQVGAPIAGIFVNGFDTFNLNPASLPIPTNIAIENNRVYNLALNNDVEDSTFGIFSQSNQDVTISNNVVSNFAGGNVIGIDSTSDQNATISSNSVVDSQALSNMLANEFIFTQGIVTYEETNYSIDNNYISGFAGEGIFTCSSTNGLIENNLVENCHNPFSTIFGDFNCDGIRICHDNNNITIENNVVLNSDTGVTIGANNLDMTVANNIFENDSVGLYVPYENNQINVTNTAFINDTYGLILDNTTANTGFDVGPASGNQITITNSLFLGEKYAVYGDSSVNTVTLIQDAFVNDTYAIYDLSTTTHDFVLNDDIFINDAHDFNYYNLTSHWV